MVRMTVAQKILLTMATAKWRTKGISFRQVVSWRKSVNFTTLYQTLNLLVRQGYISKNGYGDCARFFITNAGREKLKESGLLKSGGEEC